MRVARLTEQGIMVNPDKLHELGPVSGAIAMFADLLDSEPRYYSVRYKGKRVIHLCIDPQHGDMYIKCGLLTEGEATIWDYKNKKISCKKCKALKEKETK